MKRSLAVLGAMAIVVGFLAIASPTVASPDVPPEVVTVPVQSELLSVPHTAWIGKEIVFKGTAHDADGDATMTEYKWDFGDGYSTGWVSGVNPYVIEAKHTYTGTMADSTPYGPGKYFTAWLYVKDNTGRIGQDSYFVAIWDVSEPGQMSKAEVNVAIDNGLWWLHKQQIRDTYPDGADYGYWDNANYDVATTGAAVEAFELQGHLVKGDPYDITEDPYVETVQRGLNFLFNNAEEVPIGEDPVLCPLGDPDVNGNGIGLAIHGPDGRARMYEAGITLMTMGSSGAPTRVATTGSVTGRTYLDITQDMVEFMAWAQNEHVDYGEFIYRDVDASDDVSPGDVRLRVWWGGGWEPVAGTLVEPGHPDVGGELVPFAAEEKHADPDATDEYEWTEGIYLDLDASDDVSIGDERLSDVGTYHAGTIVALGDPDLGTALVSFAGDEKHGEDLTWDSAYNWTSGRGGWRYGGNYENSDNSVSQWPVIGMEAAERNFGSVDLTVPDFVRPELLLWLEYSQCPEPGWQYGGFGYTLPCGGNVARTGAGAAMLSWVGVPTSDPRFQDALGFLDRAWAYDNFGNYYAMYGVMKGMVIPDPDIEFIGSHDWYAEYARYIIDEQNTYGGEYVVDHSWLGPSGEGEVQNALATAWAMLILTPTVVLPGPVADAGPDVQDHPPLIAIEFDGSGSYHRAQPIKEIVEYCWDFGDGSPEECSPQPTAEHAYPALYNPDGSINWDDTARCYVATLRVVDNNVPPLEDSDTARVCITAPPWKPVADADGPYEGSKSIPICLDGSGSYDPESRMYEPGHPWYETIGMYEWDLDNDGLFDDSTNVKPCWTWDTKGTYGVCLKVTDTVPSGPGGTVGDLDVDVDCATVVISNREPVADADGPYFLGLDWTVNFDGSGSSDPDGDALYYRWDFDSDGTYDTDWSLSPFASHTYPEWKEYEVTLQVQDGDGGYDEARAPVIPDRPPDCSAAAPSITEIWPANHKMIGVNILSVADPDGDPVSIVITGITQDEPLNGLGDGDTSPDGAGVGSHTAQVRAERAGTPKVPGNGRVYHIHFKASDDRGGACSGVVKVGVPHDQRRGHVIVDGGELYDSTMP